MRRRAVVWVIGFAVVLLGGCPNSSDSQQADEGGGSAGAAGNAGAAGSGGTNAGSGGTNADSGGTNAGSGGANAGSGGANAGSGGAGSNDCGAAIPTVCRLCADSSCGTPVCKNASWTWQCPEDVDGGTASGDCVVGGCSSELCTDKADGPAASDCIYRPEYACYASASCARQADGSCGWTMTPELTQCLQNGGSSAGTDAGTSGSGSLRWYTSCGTPVCTSDPAPYDDPNIPNCTTQQLGDPCTTAGDRCDGVAACGATYICATSAPKTCPRSRARFKRDISYLDQAQLEQYHDELVSLPLASYRYKDAPEQPQLGFIIDDIEPSAAVAGDHVNMYGYLSMAVAAIKVQQQQIETLQRELEQLRAERASAAPFCGP